MQLLTENKRFIVDRVVVVLPERRDVVSDITNTELDGISQCGTLCPGLMSDTHLIVMRPIPESIAMMVNNCQNSIFFIRLMPRISTR